MRYTHIGLWPAQRAEYYIRRELYRPQREADNPTTCSGHCCGNPRRNGYYKNGKTFQEIFADWKLKESIKDWKNQEQDYHEMHTWDDDWYPPLNGMEWKDYLDNPFYRYLGPDYLFPSQESS